MNISENYKSRLKELSGIKTPDNLNDNFKEWFGDSKVVNPDGSPKVIFHGTGKKFSKFNIKKSIQPIIWFTTDKSAIDAGEVGAQGKGITMELYASIKNPAGWKEYEKYGLGQLKGLGYDGAILKDGDGFTGFVFEPNQLKSVANKGYWSESNNNIYKEEVSFDGKIVGELPHGIPFSSLDYSVLAEKDKKENKKDKDNEPKEKEFKEPIFLPDSVMEKKSLLKFLKDVYKISLK